MQLSKVPDYRAKLGRHGHNLSHDFSFTSGTGHLLTIFDELMYPDDTISGQCEMFTRTQPLLNAANVEVDEYIDYFFVPLDMLYSGFGDYIYQVNEPYSSLFFEMNSQTGSSLPVFNVVNLIEEDGVSVPPVIDTRLRIVDDFYKKDLMFFSYYRNLFHNGLNPNCLFDLFDDIDDFVHPVDTYQPNIFPLTLFAYNCVYQHFYRLDDREAFDPCIYNIDQLAYDTDLSVLADCCFKILSLKYRPKNFDYFTSCAPRPFFSGGNNIVSSHDLTNVNNYLSQAGVRPISSHDGSVGGLDDPDFTQVGINNSNSPQLSTGSFRNLFAVEKLLSITSRTKKTYDAQVLAHLGVKVVEN